MKTPLLVSAIVGISLAGLVRAAAGDPLLTPKAQASQITRVAGTTSDSLDRSVKGSPRALEMAASVRKTPGTTPDLINRTYASIPKLREQAAPGAAVFSVAPLK